MEPYQVHDHMMTLGTNFIVYIHTSLLFIRLSVIGEPAHERDCRFYLQGEKRCKVTNPRAPLRLRSPLLIVYITTLITVFSFSLGFSKTSLFHLPIRYFLAIV